MRSAHLSLIVPHGTAIAHSERTAIVQGHPNKKDRNSAAARSTLTPQRTTPRCTARPAKPARNKKQERPTQKKRRVTRCGTPHDNPLRRLPCAMFCARLHLCAQRAARPWLRTPRTQRTTARGHSGRRFLFRARALAYRAVRHCLCVETSQKETRAHTRSHRNGRRAPQSSPRRPDSTVQLPRSCGKRVYPQGIPAVPSEHQGPLVPHTLSFLFPRGAPGAEQPSSRAAEALHCTDTAAQRPDLGHAADWPVTEGLDFLDFLAVGLLAHSGQALVNPTGITHPHPYCTALLLQKFFLVAWATGPVSKAHHEYKRISAYSPGWDESCECVCVW